MFFFIPAALEYLSISVIGQTSRKSRGPSELQCNEHNTRSEDFMSRKRNIRQTWLDMVYSRRYGFKSSIWPSTYILIVHPGYSLGISSKFLWIPSKYLHDGDEQDTLKNSAVWCHPSLRHGSLGLMNFHAHLLTFSFKRFNLPRFFQTSAVVDKGDNLLALTTPICSRTTCCVG